MRKVARRLTPTVRYREPKAISQRVCRQAGREPSGPREQEDFSCIRVNQRREASEAPGLAHAFRRGITINLLIIKQRTKVPESITGNTHSHSLQPYQYWFRILVKAY